MREDWIKCKIGDIFNFVGGGTPSKTNGKYWNGDIPWASIKDIKGDFLNSTINKITYEGLTNSASNLVAIDEVILATRINPGRPIISKINTAINQDLKVVKPKVELPTLFVFYLFKFLEKQIIGLSSGTTVLGIGLNPLKDIKFSLPPLPEQRAIVKKLESLFSSLDAGVADLKKAQQQLKIYRQAVLKKAFESGNVVKLTNCCIKAEKVNRRSIELESPLKYIDIGSIDNKLNKIIGFKEYLWKDAPSRAQQIIKKGDILFSTVRTYLRNIAQVESDIYENEICSTGFTVLRADDKKLLNKYLFHFTLYNGFLDKLGELQTGTSYPAVRDKDVFEQLIPLPSVEKQHQIVKQIESRLSVCDSIEQIIKESLEKAEALRQSILKKAFEGNLLTAQELAECKLADDYEPASVLLERIKAEQTEIKAKPSKKKPRHSVAKSQ